MNTLFRRVVQLSSIPILYTIAYGLDLWSLSASYDMAWVRFSRATFFAMIFPQVIFVCVILLIGYMTVLQKPSVWVSSVYIGVGGYIALVPPLLMSAYANHSDMTFISSIVALPVLRLVAIPNSIFIAASAAVLSIGLLALFASLHAVYKSKTA